jgi:hypothetical protein
MRNYVALAPGQVWRSADPRRQFTTFFCVIAVINQGVTVAYASRQGGRFVTGRVKQLQRRAFYVTGSRGYVRES